MPDVRLKKRFILILLAAAVIGSTACKRNVPTGISMPDITVRTRKQLILDAGHGGEDGGAVSCTGVPESEINLNLVLRLDQLLGLCGEAPILLRDQDISLHDPGADTLRQKKVSDLHNRVSMVERITDGTLISIHQNTFPDASYHGAQVFYRAEPESRALADVLQHELSLADPSSCRIPAKIPESVYLMKNISCPAVLIECGFLSNPAEEARLRSRSYQLQLAACITAGWLHSLENSSSEENGTVL